MRIEYERYRTLTATINEMLYGKGINIYEQDREKTPEGRRITFGVNWGAMGTRTPEEARDFADNLKDAARVTEMLNRMEITYYYDDTEEECDWDALAQRIAKAVTRLSRFDLADALLS